MQIERIKRLFASCPVGRVTSRFPPPRVTTAHEKLIGLTAAGTRAIMRMYGRAYGVCVYVCVYVCVCVWISTKSTSYRTGGDIHKRHTYGRR